MRKFLNILSVFVLFSGVVAGVTLIQREQDIRGKASSDSLLISICHKTGVGDEFKKIEVEEGAVQLHLNHGDKLTGCDENPSDNTSTNQNITPSVNTFDEPLNNNIFEFSIRLQGLNSQGVDKNATLTFQGDSQQTRNITITSNQNGLYSGVVEGVPLGDYEVLVKVDSYLAKRFSNVDINSTNSNWDWSTTRLLMGDFNNDNIFDVLDVGMILAIYDQESVPVNLTNSQYDVNGDQVINQQDVDLVLDNYTDLAIEGDR